MSQASTMLDTAPHELDILTQAEYQEQQADQLLQDVFDGEENAEKTGNLITRFVTSYEQHKRDMPLDQWLIREFHQYPSIWKDSLELETTALEIIRTVEANNATKTSLYEHLDKGKSRESWLAKRIEEGANAAGVSNVGGYASQIEAALEKANKDMKATITTNSGFTNMGRNLDGFIAEQHHADTFNLDAVAKGSQYRAKVLIPDGKAYAKNSMDIGIYDKNDKLVRRYQAKYGQDAESTGKLFDKGDYRGQRKLGPEGHGYEERIEIEGVSSKSLTKEQAKSLQEKVQQEAEIKQYDWNDASRIAIAKNIGKQAFISAAFTAGIHGARILGRRAWNGITGKKNPPASEDLREFFESSVKSGANTGIQVAVSGAVVVAVKSGWLGNALKASPIGRITNIAYAGMENAKILYKYGKGEISGQEALDLMGNTTAGVVGSVMGAAEGAALGATLGVIGGPIGIVVGGFVGGVVGGMAGSKIGQVAYEGGKKVVNTAVKVAKSIVNTTVSAVKSVARACNPLNWF